MTRLIRIFVSFGILVVLGLICWIALPRLIGSLPNAIQQRLPHDVRALVSTPIPTALPAPEIMAQTTAVILIPTLDLQETVTATPLSLLTEEDTPTPAASYTPSVTPLPTQTPIPASAFIDGLVIDPQGFNNCGPTNLSIVLTYYGEDHHQENIAEVIRPAYEDRNVTPGELMHYVNTTSSLKAVQLWGSNLDELKELLAAGFPVIVEEGFLPSDWEGWMGHYLTLFSYDDANQTFLSMDTYLGPWDSTGRPVAYADLAEMWTHFNNVALVVYPAEEEARLLAIIGEDRLEPLAMWQQAASQAQTAVSEDSENAFAWFNLGSSLTHLGELTGDQVYYEGAAAAFDRARTLGLPWRMLWYQFEPYIAYLENGRYEDVLTLANTTINSGGTFMEESYFYRGLAMQALGKEAQAQLDFAHVLEINPNGTLSEKAAKQLE